MIYRELTDILNFAIFIYAITIMSFYLILSIISMLAMLNYIRHYKITNFDNILRSPLAPSISVIAPAYNEELSIVDNVRSLLSLHYNKYDIIIINDGSRDSTMKLLMDAYSLIPSNSLASSSLEHKEIKGIYRSSDPAYKKLTVVDKENGGKADALNAGINFSKSELIACIDVDCVLEDEALLRMVKPYLEETRRRVIATGGVIRIANDCIIKHGRLIEIKLAKKWLPAFQTLEYIRAFLLGRMAWEKLNGLLIISGAFGLFDRRIVLEVNGYDTATVGEDMELVVRMRRHMADKNKPYKVAYVPDPLCWTEAPDTVDALVKQRNRWTRGTIETLARHKMILFRRKYGLMGMLSYPFWLLYEWLAPIIEFLGIIYFIVLTIMGFVNWEHFFVLVLLVYSFAVLISWMAIFLEEATFREYAKGQFLIKLLVLALLEPIFYHPITVWAAIKGNFDKFILKKKSWGKQVRRGFATENKVK